MLLRSLQLLVLHDETLELCLLLWRRIGGISLLRLHNAHLAHIEELSHLLQLLLNV